MILIPTSKSTVRRSGRPSTEETRQITAQIMEAATRLFLRLGYQDTTFDRIAREAGTTKNALYARFPEKPDLFAAVCKGMVADTYSENIVDVYDELPLRDSLRRVATTLLDAATRPRAMEMYRLLCESASRHPEIAHSAQLSWTFYVEQIELYFVARVERGLMLLRDPHRTAELFVEMLFGQIHRRLVHNASLPTPQEMRDHLEEIILIFMGGIGQLQIQLVHDARTKASNGLQE